MKPYQSCFGIAVLMYLGAAAAQPAPSANYTTIDVEPAKVFRIGVYAQGRKDCSSGKSPIVRVVEAPLAGTLTVRPAKVTMRTIASCPNLEVPAQAVLYQGRDGAIGDHVIYSVTYPDGEIALFDVAIRFKEQPRAQ